MSTNTASPNNKLTYSELTRFFLPIAATAMIMMSGNNIVSSALAKTASAEVAIAAYAVAQSVQIMAQAPIWALMRLSVSLGKDKESSKNVRIVAFSAAAVVIAIMATIGFTPVGRFIFVNILGIQPELLPETVKTFRVFMFLPIFGVIRQVYQGFITLARKTYILTISVILRVVAMLAMAAFLTTSNIVEGGMVGAIIICSGFILESIVALITGRKFLKQLPEIPLEGEVPAVASIWLFFLPLIAAQLLTSFVNPSINAGLAQSANPEQAIASFYVARSLAWIFIGLGFRIHQLVLVFVKDKHSWMVVKRFVMVIGVIMTSILLTLSLTPLGGWVLMNIIGVDPELTNSALKTMTFLSFVPIAMFIAEVNAGLLLHNKKASVITLGKVANVASLFVTIFVLSTWFPQLGGLLGGIGMLVAYSIEALILLFLARKLNYTNVEIVNKRAKHPVMAKAATD